MRRWPPSSADRGARGRAAAGAVAVGGLALGLASEAVAYGWHDVRHWLPDLVVGLACLAAGAWSLSRRPGAGALLVAIGGLWFAGNLWSALLHTHRGPLTHLIVTYPGWRPRGRQQLAVVMAAYLVSLTRVPSSNLGSAAVAGAVLAYAGWLFLRSRGRARRDRATAFGAAAAYAVATAVGAVVRTVEPSGDAVEPMHVLYEVSIVWIAVLFATRLTPAEPAAVADLVVELGEQRSGELEGALGTALGDPTLRVGFRTDAGDYVDDTGRPLSLPSAGGDRAATFIDRNGGPFAVLVHDAAVLDDPALVEAVSTATRLATANDALSSEVRARLGELAASRRRVVVAADEERRRLAATLHHGVEQHVAELRSALASAADSSSAATADHLRRAADHLDHTAADLRQLARGLHPRELDAGLAGALAFLAERCPVPVDLSIDHGVTPGGEVALTAYYVCAEALANVAKHADATTARVALSRSPGCLHVTVSDDGRGGADPAAGTGLRGLADRVEALGGRLTVTSPAAGGTRLVAELPLGHQS